MPEVSVSTDALARVKAALNFYHADISGFSAKMEQHSSDILKSAELEMQKIARQVEDVTKEISQLKTKINQLGEAINHMGDEKKSAEQLLESSQKLLPVKQDEAERLRKQIAELERIASEAKGEMKAAIQATINELRRKLSEVEAEIRRLKDQISALRERISQLQQKIHEARAEKAKKEDELRTTQGLLNRLRDKQERMKTAHAKLKDDMNVMLAASKSFETRAVSETEQNMGNIEKCIAAVDEYLSGTQSGGGVSSRDMIVAAAMSRADSPTVAAQALGGAVTQNPTVAAPGAQLAQMAMSAAIPATSAYMGATIRQHGRSPAAELENMQIQQAIDEGAQQTTDKED